MKQISSLFTIKSHNTDLERLFFFFLLKNTPHATLTRRRIKRKRTSANIYIYISERRRLYIQFFFSLSHVRCDLIRRDSLKTKLGRKRTNEKTDKKFQKKGRHFFNKESHTPPKRGLKMMDGTRFLPLVLCLFTTEERSLSLLMMMKYFFRLCFARLDDDVREDDALVHF